MIQIHVVPWEERVTLIVSIYRLILVSDEDKPQEEENGGGTKTSLTSWKSVLRTGLFPTRTTRTHKSKWV